MEVGGRGGEESRPGPPAGSATEYPKRIRHCLPSGATGELNLTTKHGTITQLGSARSSNC